jgi:MarR family transcriptional repressor of mepA
MSSNEHQNEVQRLFRSIAIRAKKYMDRRLAQYELTHQQGHIIGFIYGETKKGKTVCQHDLQERFEVTGASVTSLLQGLERKGYILRRASESDARVKELIVTEKGQALISQFSTVFDNAEEWLLQGFSEEERMILISLLRRMLKNMK